MINQVRLDELKRIIEPRDFFGALLCDVPNIVKTHREVFEAKAKNLSEKRRPYVEACEAVAKKAKKRKDRSTTTQKSPQLPDDFFDCFKICDPLCCVDSGVGGFFRRMMDIKTITLTPEDALLRDYGIVAVLFNKYAEERGETLIAPEILSDIEIPQNYEKPEDKRQWPEVRAILINALEAVNQDLASTKKSQPAKGATSSEKKHWYNTVWVRMTGAIILTSVIISAILGVIQILESDTYKQFVAARPKSQSVYDPNTQTESNDIMLPPKTNDDTSNSLPDSNLSPPESPNQ